MEPMCGRYSLADPARLRGAFPAIRFPEFSETRIPAMQPRYNIAPTQEVLGVRNDGRDTAELLR
ncbi:MAG: SOS response-associated peptidase, partial [Candidatus Eremiobacteraeota bacterium]|nr:SOS response-associated peptidase [Candidatus Eremiobacteraeota bacterium]